MATTYYNLPTINGSDTVDGVNAINGLANAVDVALHGISADFPDTSKLENDIKDATNKASAAQAAASGAQATAESAQTAARAAQSTAQAAQSTADGVASDWAAAPVDIIAQRISPYATSSEHLTAYNWGNVVVVKFKIQNPTIGSTVTVGKLKAGYAPTADITVAAMDVANDSMGYIGVRGGTGDIVCHGAGSATELAGIVCYLAGVQ